MLVIRSRLLVALTLITVLVSPSGASADPPEIGVVRDFGPNLTAACPHPEGIAVDPRGNVYAASFATGVICIIDRTGALVDTIPTGTAIIGMLFDPSSGLYAIDFANDRVLLIDPTSHSVTVVATLGGGPNALAQDQHGNLYVSDSFGGRIWMIARDGTTTVWKQDPLLATAGFPPFGANGIAFDRSGSALYVANTGDDTVLRIAVNADGTAGAVSVFASAATVPDINGPDGIAFDVQGNLYIASNQADMIVVVSPSGAWVTTYTGTGPAALHFPASIVFKGRDLYITNLAFDHSFNPLPDSKVSVLTAPLPGAPLR